MKKKIIILLCVILTITTVGMGTKGIRKRAHNYYKNHFTFIDYIFKDRHLVVNATALNDERKNKRNLWDDYYSKSLKINARQHLNMPTAYFSKQATHPDVLYFKEGRGGYKYWMAYTPYPNSKDKYENPHIIAGNSERNMRVPKGLKNPIVPPPLDTESGGHLSDTDISYRNNKFLVHYVYNKKGIPGPSKFYRTESKDGTKWDKPRLVYESKETTEGYSPALVYEGNKSKMWYVGGEGNLVYTESLDDEGSWSKAQRCNIKINGWNPWHVDVIKTDRKYEGLLCARSAALDTRALFYIDSVDGLNWRASKYPIIFPDKKGWDNSEIYRSTFIKDNDDYKIWYAARNGNKKWYIGYTSVRENVIENLEMN